MPSVCRARTVGAAPPTSTSTRPCRPGGRRPSPRSRRRWAGRSAGRSRGRSGAAGCAPRGVDQQGPGVRGEVGGELAGQVDHELGLRAPADVQTSSSSRPRRSCRSSSRWSPGTGANVSGSGRALGPSDFSRPRCRRGADDPDRQAPESPCSSGRSPALSSSVARRRRRPRRGRRRPGRGRRVRPARSGCRRRWRCRRRPARGRSPARPGSRPRRPAGPARHPTAGVRWPGGRRTARRPSARTRRRRCRRTTTRSPRPAAAWRGACPRAGRSPRRWPPVRRSQA